MNYWKQLNHVLKYFSVEENPNVRLPSNFIGGFLEVSLPEVIKNIALTGTIRDEIDSGIFNLH